MARTKTDTLSTEILPLATRDISMVNVIDVEHRIFTIRGVQVMVDRDLAELYGVETRRINEQVKRNIDRFPERFMFQLNEEEFAIWKSQIATSNWTSPNAIPNSIKMGIRRAPYVFTEQGVAMLATVLNSKESARVSIAIMDAFVAMRRFIAANAQIFHRLDRIELKQLQASEKHTQLEQRFDNLLDRLGNGSIKPIEGVFYDGQIFDAYVFVADLIKGAQQSVVLIDNYVDESVLTMLDKRLDGVSATIYTQTISKQLQLDINKHNAQYRPIRVEKCKSVHDRFLLIDNTVYHIGASIKDLGKKLFAFSKMEIPAKDILKQLN